VTGALVILIAALGAAGAGAADADRSKDSDGDGIPDVEEDPNGNGIVDPGESDPKNVDTDHDNVPDEVERRMGSNPNDRDDVPPIPEPLLFDLVRNLGSRRGEMEANVIASTSFRRTGTFSWGPEIEYAPVKGLGFEIEVPFIDGKIDALKFGSQLTVASFLARHLEVGVIGSYARSMQERGLDGFVGVVTGIRFSAHVQGMLIAGPTVAREESRTSFGATLNPSLFYQLTRSFTFGVETGHRFEPDQRTYVLPQLHVNPFDAFAMKVQAGGGVEILDGSVAPLVALRFAVER
jgi:hypothetical protein